MCPEPDTKPNKNMTRFKDKCVLITGGGSGIGRIMGRLALERGARKVVVWDIDERNIAASLAAYAAPERTAGYRADVSDRRQVEETFARTTAECGPVEIIINCAGIITGNKTFDRQTPEALDIASAAGMNSNPRMAVYAASKWAVIGWSDSLRIELQEARSGVHVTTVAPYYIATGMFAGVRSRLVPILDPEKTARPIVRAVDPNRTLRGLPWGFHLIRQVQGLLPDKLFDALVGNAMGIYRTMDHFTGRRTPDHTSNR